MRKIYLKILVGIVVCLWALYFIQNLINYYMNYKKEPFTPKLHGVYRPYIRRLHQHYESFMNNYGSDVIMTKLKKWNIY